MESIYELGKKSLIMGLSWEKKQNKIISIGFILNLKFPEDGL